MLIKPFIAPRGFTLIELLTVLTVASILVALGFPIIGKWLKNSEVRTVAESLQDGLRYAQSQAVTQNIQTSLVLANSPPASSTTTASVNPANGWYSTTVVVNNGTPLIDSTIAAAGLQTAALGNVAGGVSISGSSSAVCFNSFGRLTANSTPGPANAVCALPTTPAAAPVQTFAVSIAGSDRPLNVTVGLTGQVRMCDPAKTLSATNPDGC